MEEHVTKLPQNVTSIPAPAQIASQAISARYVSPKLNLYWNAKHFHCFVVFLFLIVCLYVCLFVFCMHIYVFWGHEFQSIDQYQNVTPKNKVIPWVEKEVLISREFQTRDFIGHWKMLCMCVVLLRSGVESKWKQHSFLLRVEKMLAF